MILQLQAARICVMENSHDFSADFDLLCTENREFLYERSEGALQTNVNPNLVWQVDKPLEYGKLADTERQTATWKEVKGPPTKKRKRNSAKDKLRTEAEQNAYKKLKQIVPSLRESKRVTKLETIRQACLYIEKLQETLTGIRS